MLLIFGGPFLAFAFGVRIAHVLDLYSDREGKHLAMTPFPVGLIVLGTLLSSARVGDPFGDDQPTLYGHTQCAGKYMVFKWTVVFVGTDARRLALALATERTMERHATNGEWSSVLKGGVTVQEGVLRPDRFLDGPGGGIALGLGGPGLRLDGQCAPIGIVPRSGVKSEKRLDRNQQVSLPIRLGPRSQLWLTRLSAPSAQIELADWVGLPSQHGHVATDSLE